MSAPNEDDMSQPSKRPYENSSSQSDESKRIKVESTGDINEDQFNDLFDDPLFNQNGNDHPPAGSHNGNDNVDLPDFLQDPLPEGSSAAPTTSNSEPAVASPITQAHTAPVTAVHSSQPSKSPTPASQRPSSAGPQPGAPGKPNTTQSSALQGDQKAESTATGAATTSQSFSGQSPSLSTGSSLPPSATPMYQSQSQYPYSTYNKTTLPQYPQQYRQSPGATSYKPGTRFDPRRTYPAPTGMGSSYSTSSVPGYGIASGVAPVPGSTGSTQPTKEDPDQYKDAIHAAGVDISREEELLSTNYNRVPLSIQQQQFANRQRQLYGSLNAFLQPYHVGLFMNRTARENGVFQNFMADPEMLEFMSAACKEWLSNIITKTITLSRHRRRGIPTLVQSRGSNKTKSPSSQRSDVSKELRNIALRHKEQEEQRVAKRLALGVENRDEVAPESSNKAGAEETLHRAANATAAMMTGGSSTRKKYSWMKSGGGGGGDDGKTGASKDGGPKQSPLISSRGDNGLRFREIRTGNMVTTKDLLGVLEDERMGTSKAVIKGYAKLKD
ncbi:transcription initiation factor TFIID subunit 4 [Candidozyma auris]|uniref:Transcription initiation factor TFIID subunit 4 n=2 Tax=Candidozyma auris TaxID=498019 RepID=A0AB36W8M3_CANAR|nr:hypothetical protein QG37_00665 [[Candida] auris]PIS56219.1 hypothetical protein CJI97_001466 [[Candida] auris]PIS56603.1 hypothetical protein B9J08_001140 [[Candida] auris]QWW24114.1 hypothetical protein CA7LBN_002948 [[Candida] auris]